MALNWSIEKVKDLKEIQTESEAVITDALVWATMTVGIREITDDNALEFYTRLHAYEKLNGTFTNEAGKPRYITLQDVERRVGLNTNASQFSRTEFNKRLLRSYYS